MRIFKRFFLYVLSIAAVVILASAALLIPWINTPTDLHDQALRAGLAGQIDTLVIGQSYSMNGIIPGKLDEKLGTTTYNTSGSMMPIYGQKIMLEKELSRNPIRNVILEITPDTFTTDERGTNGNGDSYIITRLDSFGERLDYLFKYVPLSEWPDIYARTLMLSMRCAAYRLLGRVKLIDDSNMGFSPQKAEDVTLSPDLTDAQRMAMNIFYRPLEENIRGYEELITLCQQAGCQVTIIYPIVSHAKVWQLYDQDDYRLWAQELADKYGVALFDFNLLKSRYELFSDKTSFSDQNHLSQEGAEVFSEVMADVLLRYRNVEDVSSLFFSSYAEAIRNSVYESE